MTITYVGIENNRQGEVYKSETLNFVFETDNQTRNPKTTDTIFDVLQDRNCPRINTVHPYCQWLVCANLAYRESPGKFVITASYRALKSEEAKPSERPPATAGRPPEDDPTDDNQPIDFTAKLSISFEEFSQPATAALNNSERQSDISKGTPVQGTIPIVASNLERYDPPPEVYTNNPIIDINRNVATRDRFFYIRMLNLQNAINNENDGLMLPEFSLKIPPLSARFRFSIGEDAEGLDDRGQVITYRPVNIQLLVRWDTWRARLLDIGSYEFTDTGTLTIAQRIVNGDWSYPGSNFATTPFLDDDGNRERRLLDGQGNFDTAPTTPAYNEYSLYREKTMSDFLSIYTLGQIVKG